MDAFPQSTMGIPPLAATSLTGSPSGITAYPSTDIADQTFASLLQTQLQADEPGHPDVGEGQTAASREAEGADVARQLESLLLYHLLKEMWATVPEGTLLETGLAGEFYREMWLEALADEISRGGGGIGLADVLAADIARLSL